MSSTAQALRALKSKDPAQRKAAIKAVARAKNPDALKQLARMAGDDPDREIRKLAKQAGVYIRQQIGDLPAEEAAASSKDDKKTKKVYVDPKDAQRSQEYLQSAMTANINNDKARSAKMLAKALALDPNQTQDAFFVSLAEQATGLTGQEAVAAVGDANRVADVEQQELRKRENQSIEEHLAKISKSGWRDVAFDFAIVATIAIIGSMLILFLVVQQAQGYWDSYESNIEKYNEAYATGIFARDNDDDVIVKECLGPGAIDFERTGSPLTNTVVVTKQAESPTEQDETMTNPVCSFHSNSAYWPVNAFWRGQSTMEIVVRGLMIGVGIVATLGLLVIVTHVAAGTLFRGEGRLPYYADQVGALMMNRVLLLAIITGVTGLLYFSGGGASGTLFLGVIAIYLATVVLTIISKTGDAYRISPVTGGMAVLIGLAAGGTFAAVGGFLLL